MRNVLVTPEGGHGTVFIWKRMRQPHKMLTRPDVIFGPDLDLDAYPQARHVRAWARRTGFKGYVPPIDLGKTIEQNFVQLIEEHDGWILLSGRISAVKPFFTRNNLKAYGLIRNPEDAYVSFMKIRHPNHAAPFGGFDTPEAVDWWAGRWLNIVHDLRDSGSIVCDFTNFPQGTGNQDLIGSLNGWKAGLQHRDLSASNRALLQDLTQETYGQLVRGL